MSDLQDLDKRLLDALQKQIPLVDRPFERLGRDLGLSEEDVIGRIERLKTGPTRFIRQISAIFDSASLGYRSSLVAAKVEPLQIEHAAAIISAHPGVSHNYERQHAYNLWYTVTVPPDSRLGLEKTVQILHQRSDAKVTRLMPAYRIYKIGVKFDMSGEAEQATSEPRIPNTEHRTPNVAELSEADKRMIRALQQDLPLTSRPFEQWATQAEVSEADLTAAAARFLETKAMRRFSAVLHHRAAGFTANAMGAWVVPPEQHDEFGQMAASVSAVSHCYLRPTFEDWPYSIFTMVHGRKSEDCQAALAEIARRTGIAQYTALYSTREFKKVRVRYFTGENEAWEAAAEGQANG